MIEGDIVRDDILNVLSNSNGAMDIYELKDALQIEKVKDIQELNTILKAIRKVDSVYEVNRKK